MRIVCLLTPIISECCNAPKGCRKLLPNPWRSLRCRDGQDGRIMKYDLKKRNNYEVFLVISKGPPTYFFERNRLLRSLDAINSALYPYRRVSILYSFWISRDSYYLLKYGIVTFPLQKVNMSLKDAHDTWDSTLTVEDCISRCRVPLLTFLTSLGKWHCSRDTYYWDD